MAFMSVMLAVGLDQSRQYISSFAIVAFIVGHSLPLSFLPKWS